MLDCGVLRSHETIVLCVHLCMSVKYDNHLVVVNVLKTAAKNAIGG